MVAWTYMNGFLHLAKVCSGPRMLACGPTLRAASLHALRTADIARERRSCVLHVQVRS